MFVADADLIEPLEAALSDREATATIVVNGSPEAQRSHSVLADHYGRAAALGREGGVQGPDLIEMRRHAVRFLEEAGDAAARLYSNR